MRVLVIDESAKMKVARVAAYANESAHHYIPEISKVPPGDNPEHVCFLSSYRCVFSLTHASGKLWKHLSISVPSELYPNPVAAEEIAHLVGFVGRLDEWQKSVNRLEHCIVLAQEVVGCAGFEPA